MVSRVLVFYKFFGSLRPRKNWGLVLSRFRQWQVQPYRDEGVRLGDLGHRLLMKFHLSSMSNNSCRHGPAILTVFLVHEPFPMTVFAMARIEPQVLVTPLNPTSPNTGP